MRSEPGQGSREGGWGEAGQEGSSMDVGFSSLHRDWKRSSD